MNGMRTTITASSRRIGCSRRIAGTVLAVTLLSGCESNGSDWRDLFPWMKSDEAPAASSQAATPEPVPAAVAPPPSADPYWICRECPVQGDRVVPISDRILGFVERIDRSSDAISFVGWAMDQNDPNSSLRLLLFAGGVPVAEGSTEQLRLDIIVRYKLSGEGRHGFRLSVPSQHFRTENTHVNLYALDRNGSMGLVRFSVSN
jgi:hypothetical protein